MFLNKFNIIDNILAWYFTSIDIQNNVERNVLYFFYIKSSFSDTNDIEYRFIKAMIVRFVNRIVWGAMQRYCHSIGLLGA